MKIRILSLLTLVCILFSSVIFAQTYYPDNTVKRVACLSGYSGCSALSVTLELGKASGLFYEKQSYDINHPELSGKNYRGYLNKIKITISGRSTSGTYYLPTTIGETVAIAGDAGLGSYNVYIKKTAASEFYLSAFESNY